MMKKTVKYIVINDSLNLNSLNWWWTPGGCLLFRHAL